MTQPNAKLVEVARAMWDAANRRGALFDMDPLPFPALDHPDIFPLLDDARAAIRTLMEPSEDMAADGRLEVLISHACEVEARAAAIRTYHTMLANVLEEKR